MLCYITCKKKQNFCVVKIYWTVKCRTLIYEFTRKRETDKEFVVVFTYKTPSKPPTSNTQFMLTFSVLYNSFHYSQVQYE